MTPEEEKQFTALMDYGGEIIDYEGDLRRGNAREATKKIKSFISRTLKAREEALRERILGMMRTKESDQVEAETPIGKQDREAYNQALTDLLDTLQNGDKNENV